MNSLDFALNTSIPSAHRHQSRKSSKLLQCVRSGAYDWNVQRLYQPCRDRGRNVTRFVLERDCPSTIQKQPFLTIQEGLSHVRSFMREFGFQFQLEYVRQFFMGQLGEVRLFDVCPGP